MERTARLHLERHGIAERERRWTEGWVRDEARRRGSTPEEQLLAIFDLFDEWFRRDDFEACSFINVLLEMGRGDPAGDACVHYLRNIRGVVGRLAEEAGLRDRNAQLHRHLHPSPRHADAAANYRGGL